jgi:hypothetical protein
MQAPRQEHHWLQRLIGDWTSEAWMTVEPGKPPERCRGTERVRPLGDLWVLAEGQGDIPGGGLASMLLTLGYDLRQRRFVGTWVASMMTHLWVYDGALDDTGRVLTLQAEGPSMRDPFTLAKYRDVIELVSDDHRVLTSQALGDDGTWHAFMRADYRRAR